MNICGFAICGLAHLKNLGICDSEMSLRICGLLKKILLAHLCSYIHSQMILKQTCTADIHAISPNKTCACTLAVIFACRVKTIRRNLHINHVIKIYCMVIYHSTDKFRLRWLKQCYLLNYLYVRALQIH
jgi:hypothetical protein